ncbi:MAG: hypothetical protein D6722_19230 [Bacteroidetes bacterium]|nr:MAG: hypothetical protein D6722_19230 [Bacteroidota bacterium]
MNKSWWLLALLLPLMTACQLNRQRLPLATALPLRDVVVELSPLADKYRLDEPILMTFTVTNTGTHAVRISRWSSPLEGRFTTDYLDVHRKRERILYTGDRLHRNPWLLKDFVTLHPGERLACEVDLSRNYAITEGGRYEVRFRGSGLNRLPDSDPVEIKIKD